MYGRVHVYVLSDDVGKREYRRGDAMLRGYEKCDQLWLLNGSQMGLEERSESDADRGGGGSCQCDVDERHSSRSSSSTYTGLMIVSGCGPWTVDLSMGTTGGVLHHHQWPFYCGGASTGPDRTG